MDKKHEVTLSNIFFKNFCLFESPKSNKELAFKSLEIIMIIQLYFFLILTSWKFSANFGLFFKLSVTRNAYVRQVLYGITLAFLL